KLHANGLTRDLNMDYGDFSIRSKLVNLALFDTAPQKACNQYADRSTWPSMSMLPSGTMPAAAGATFWPTTRRSCIGLRCFWRSSLHPTRGHPGHLRHTMTLPLSSATGPFGWARLNAGVRRSWRSIEG